MFFTALLEIGEIARHYPSVGRKQPSTTRDPTSSSLDVVEPDDSVVVTVVSGEPEAEVVCGLLRSAGIECAYRDTQEIDSPLEDFTAAGRREILVHASDLETARELIGASPS
jgi:hypothetical protein